MSNSVLNTNSFMGGNGKTHIVFEINKEEFEMANKTKKPKVITFGTQKGGTGKTNSAFNIVGFLSKEHKKVLVIDVDPQANMSNLFGLNQFTEEYDFIGNVLEDGISPLDVVIEHPISEMPLVDIIPSHALLTAVEMRLVSKDMRHALLANWFMDHKQFYEKYDYIVFDTPPALNISTQNALFCSDNIILITDINLHGIQGVTMFINQWEKTCKVLGIENRITGLLVNKYDKREGLSEEFKAFVNANPFLRDLSFGTIIPANIRLKEQSACKLPINYYDTKNAGYNAYCDFYNELKERGVL